MSLSTPALQAMKLPCLFKRTEVLCILFQITSRCNELELTQKRSSKESYDAFSIALIRSHAWFRTLPPPLGIHNIPIHQLIDIDKNGFYLKSYSSNFGRGYRTCRVLCPSYYRRNESQLNLILAVELGNVNIHPHLDGSIERPNK